jgi:hypothetical protein
MPEFPLDPDLVALSTALGGLAPAAAAIDRDRLLFEAGRRSVRRPWASPMLTGVFAVLAIGFGVRLMTAPPQVQTVYVVEASRERERPEFLNSKLEFRTPVAEAPGSPRAGAEYLHLRDQVVRFGADSLPAAVVGPSAPPPPVEHMLGLPRGTLSDAQKSRWEHQLFQGGA